MSIATELAKLTEVFRGWQRKKEVVYTVNFDLDPVTSEFSNVSISRSISDDELYQLLNDIGDIHVYLKMTCNFKIFGDTMTFYFTRIPIHLGMLSAIDDTPYYYMQSERIKDQEFVLFGDMIISGLINDSRTYNTDTGEWVSELTIDELTLTRVETE